MSLSKQQEFRETRRLKAMQLLKSGKNQTQIATELGVSCAAVSQWVKAARLGGKAALEAKGVHGLTVSDINPKIRQRFTER